MSKGQKNTYGKTQGIRLLNALAEEGQFIFSASEAKVIALRLGVPKGYLDNLLPYLVDSGWLIRLRRGLYARSGTLPGDIHIHSFVIATHLVSPSAVSHWSALNYHGLTEQVPMIVTAFTPKKVVTPSMRKGCDNKTSGRHAWEIAGVRYEYVSVKREHFFGIEEVWLDENFKIPITDRERTMLETFITTRMFGGMGEALGVLENHIHELDLEKLAAYALRYGKASVIKRLGWALEQTGATEDILAPLLNPPVSGYRLLDPTRPAQGPCNKRWMIQDNLRGEISR
jgi:predicted transcriptional regulator of viral defense system